jgi:hypothetical protein
MIEFKERNMTQRGDFTKIKAPICKTSHQNKKSKNRRKY